MPSPIDHEKIPGADINPDAIDENARTVGTISGQVADHGSNVQLKWQGMAGVYEAPESPTLLGLMAPVGSQATQVSDNLAEVSAALIAFASDVRPIKAELDALRAEAKTFVDSIQGGVQVREINPAWTAAQSPYGGATAMPTYQGSWGSSTTSSSSAAAPDKYRTVTKEWHESQEHVDRNNELIAAVNAQQVKLWEAERACANRIRALYGAALLHAAQSEDDALGYGISEIPEGTEMPWGADVERTEGCGEATAKFVVKDFLWEGVIVGGIGGTLSGLGSLLVGFDPATWTFFSTDAWGSAWGGLGTLAAGALMNSTPPLNILLMADDVAQNFGGQLVPQQLRDFKNTTDEAFLNMGKSLIAWDKWQDDPGTALGESVFNVATIIIPAGAAVSGVKTAAGAASAVSKTAKFVDFVDPTAHAMNGAMKLGGAGIKGLDGIIGRLGSDATDGFHLNTPDMPFVADDPIAAMRALDDAGVDLNSITARVDDGIPVYEFPPTEAIPSGRIEMPAGAFDAVRGGDVPVRTDGGTDAGVAAPVREPELVSASSVRGETGPGAVNSIVEDAPVRTETGGAGESTVVRDPLTDTGGGNSHAGGESGGHGGSNAGNGGGLGRGEDASSAGRGDEDAGFGRSEDGPNEGSGDDGTTRESSSTDLGVDDTDATRAAGSDSSLAGRPDPDASNLMPGTGGITSPVVDDLGRDITSSIQSSSLSHDEILDFLRSSDPEAAKRFDSSGVWPSETQVPHSPSVLTRGSDGTLGIDWSQVPKRGYALDSAGEPIKAPYTPVPGEVFDRYGPPSGTFTSPVPDTGPFPYDNRSLPFVEDAGHYHRYELLDDMQNLRAHYVSAPPQVQALVDRAIARGYFDWGKQAHRGPIAPGFGASGGGIQVELPLPVNVMIGLGMMREIP